MSKKNNIKTETLLLTLIGVVGLMVSYYWLLFYEVPEITKNFTFFRAAERMDLHFYYFFYVLSLIFLPVFISSVGIYKLKQKPVISGAFSLTGGIIIFWHYISSLSNAPKHFLIISATILIIIGTLTLIRSKGK